MKHIDARQAWVEALRDDGLVKLSWVPTKDNLADLNSKILPVPRFELLRDKILSVKALPELKEAEVSQVAMARRTSLALQGSKAGFSASNLFPPTTHRIQQTRIGSSHMTVRGGPTKSVAPGACNALDSVDHLVNYRKGLVLVSRQRNESFRTSHLHSYKMSKLPFTHLAAFRASTVGAKRAQGPCTRSHTCTHGTEACSTACSRK